jgi:hypothetical protein
LPGLIQVIADRRHYSHAGYYDASLAHISFRRIEAGMPSNLAGMMQRARQQVRARLECQSLFRAVTKSIAC